MDIPQIRDMVNRCRRCGNICFALNSDDLCDDCAKGAPKEAGKSELPDCDSFSIDPPK